MNQSAKRIRNVRFLVIIGVLFCGIALSTTGLVHAQDLEINYPTGYAYGDVIVGESKTVTFDLLNAGQTYVWVYQVGLNDTPDYTDIITPQSGENTLGAFSFDPDDDVWNYIPFPGWEPRIGIPREMPGGSHIMIDVIFTPISLGDYSAYLYIESNDAIGEPGQEAYIHLQGTGVDASPVPIPAAIWLLGSGLIGLVGLRRKMQK